MRRFHAFLTGVMQVNITSFFSPCVLRTEALLFYHTRAGNTTFWFSVPGAKVVLSARVW